MGIEQSPYVGTWKLGAKKLVKMTPDALVFLNGDTSLPGCPTCNRKIDIQQFLTDVSVEAGTDSSGASTTLTLSVPVHHTDSFARDGQFILHPGLEIHVYMRGYFPVQGLFAPLAKPTVTAEVVTGGTEASDPAGAERQVREAREAAQTVIKPGRRSATEVVAPTESGSGLSRQQVRSWAERLGVTEDMLVAAIVLYSEAPPAKDRQKGEAESIVHSLFNRQVLRYGARRGYDNSIWSIANRDNEYTNKQSEGGRDYSTGRIPRGKTLDSNLALVERVLQDRATTGNTGNSVTNFFHVAAQQENHAKEVAANKEDPSVKIRHRSPDSVQSGWEKNGLALVDGFDPNVVRFFREGAREVPPSLAEAGARAALGLEQGEPVAVTPSDSALIESGALASPPPPGGTPLTQASDNTPDQQKVGQVGSSQGPSLLENLGLGDTGIDEVIAYPYYHVFRGVVTQVGSTHASGVQTFTVQGQSLLHFWEHQQVAEQGAVLGARAANSKVHPHIEGHIFTGRHPYEILYYLHADVGGAQGGVGWVLSSKQNQEGKTFNGEDMFSAVIRYWEQRFKGRGQRLRFHGMSGEILSAAQAAYLSTRSTTELENLIKSRHTVGATTEYTGKEFLRNAWATHVRDKAALNALVQSQQANETLTAEQQEALLNNVLLNADLTPETREILRNTNTRSNVQINLAEMQPFPLDLGKIAAFEFFETTYVSKMDVAKKVSEITGFEFYQDVDGDLVFKPPLYNLDTSSSRVYRLEDIDIISIAFTEKEPDFTYISVQGEFFKNITGSGIANEWGKRARYIDYRLVAQFGWRPASMDVAYYSNPSAMYYAGINRLDILNAPAKSAQASIPLRPEIRPGFPVYIPYLDSFYYLPSLSHGFAVGGSCQTQLNLVGRRAKFFAPGYADPTLRGIGAIDLAKTFLPARPLQIMDQAGHPRLSGFPNVVMALDPEEVNPLWALTGLDVDNLGDPTTVENLLKAATQLNILSKDSETGVYTFTLPDATGQNARTVRFSVQGTGETTETRQAGDGVTVVNVSQVAEKFRQQAESRGRGKAEIQRAITEITQEIQAQERILTGSESTQSQKDAANRALRGVPAGEDLSASEREQIGPTTGSTAERRARSLKERKVRTGLYGRRKLLEERLSSLQEPEPPDGQRDGLTDLIQLLNLIGAKFRVIAGPDFKNLDASAALLDTLASKKATFSNDKLPGYYRYYSASHPDPKHQGQDEITATLSSDKTGTMVGKASSLENPVRVRGYAKNPTASFPDGSKPEAELVDDHEVRRGIRIVRPTASGTEVVPTSDIKEVVFARHTLKSRRTAVSNERTMVVEALPAIEEAMREGMTLEAVGARGQVHDMTTPEVLFKQDWDRLVSYLEESRQVVERSFDGTPFEGKVPLISLPLFPSPSPVQAQVSRHTVVDGIPIPMKLSGKTILELAQREGNPMAPLLVTTPTPTILMRKVGLSLGRRLSREVKNARAAWIQKLTESVSDKNLRAFIIRSFDSILVAKLRSEGASKDTTAEKRDAPTEVFFETPVFPVSDAGGYEVIGSFRYGRDLDIDPSGAWNRLHEMDPTALLSRELVEKIIRVVLDEEPIDTFVEEQQPDGQIRLVQQTSLTGQEAVTALEKQALRELRNMGLTNQDLLDMHLAKATGDPNKLEIGLANFIPTKDKDGLQKVSLINAAYSLAELSATPPGEVCACKAAEAGLLLEAFGQEGFIELEAGTVSTVSQESPDRLTQWLGKVTAEQVPDWRDHQNALRGEVIDRRGSTLIESFRDVIDGRIQQNIENADRARRATVSAQADIVRALGAGGSFVDALDDTLGEGDQ